MPHNHHHHGGSHQCEAESTSADQDNVLEMGIQYSLFKKIDTENLECLNEAEENSGKKVFKAYENRLDFGDFVDSDCDQELLFNIPFTGNVKLKGIVVIGNNDETHPKKMRL